MTKDEIIEDLVEKLGMAIETLNEAIGFAEKHFIKDNDECEKEDPALDLYGEIDDTLGECKLALFFAEKAREKGVWKGEDAKARVTNDEILN